MISHAIIAVLIKDNKFLLLEDSRAQMLGHWAPVHGRCKDKDKSEKDSVIQEVLEETNLRVNPVRKLWTTKADTKTKTVTFWSAEIISGKIKIDKKETSRYGWFTLEEGLKLKLYPGTRKFFEKVKNKKIIL